MNTTTVTTVEELRDYVGQEIGLSDWFQITQERVNQFADATGDHQYIHVDPERAAQTFFGGTIAHGYMTLALIGYLGWEGGGQRLNIELGEKLSVNYGVNKVRFPAPVPVGKRIRVRTTLAAIEDLGERGIQMTESHLVEVEGSDKPACVAETLVRMYF